LFFQRGQPSAGFGFFMAIPTASSQFATPVIFNRSGSGPLAVRFGFASLAFTIALSGFFFIVLQNSLTKNNQIYE
jgi:hypothetical protein